VAGLGADNVAAPATQWNFATNAHVIADDGATKTVSFAEPSIPAYFM
jgi:hypothetical protein